jgi:hypothetical protein
VLVAELAQVVVAVVALELELVVARVQAVVLA